MASTVLHRAHKKGQRELALFVWLSACVSLAHAQWLDPRGDWPTPVVNTDKAPEGEFRGQRLLIQSETFASDAPLSSTYWQRGSMDGHSKMHDWHWDHRALVQWRGGSAALHIGHVQQGQLTANQNALFLAAQKSGQIDVSGVQTARHSIQARLWQLEGTVLGAVFAGQWGNGLRWQVMPELMNIHAYRQGHADAVFEQSDEKQLLTGQLRQIGTQSFGFLMNDRKDAGWAALVHIKMNWHHAWGETGVQINNAFNRLHFSTVHFADTDYLLQALNGQLQLNDLPSVSGEYGVRTWRGQVPRTWVWQYSPSFMPTVSIGQLGLDDQKHGFIAYTYPIACGQLRAQTVSLANVSVNFGCAFLGQKLHVGTGLTADVKFRAMAWSGVHIQWRW